MSMTIGRNNSNVRRIELRNIDGSYAGSISYTVPSRKKKKHLNYNFKAMSAQIMQAKTSGNARQVAAKARRKTAMLQMNIRNDDYDQEDLTRAINHAKSLERVAKKRMKHLSQEEAIKNKDNPYLSEVEDAVEEYMANEMDVEELLKLSEEELKQMMRELEDAMKELEAQDYGRTSRLDNEEQLSDFVSEETDAMDLEQLKKKHRSDELREIMEADMRYLRALFNKLAREKQNAGSSSGSSNNSNSSSAPNVSDSVSLELSGVEVPVQAAEIPAAVEGGNMDVCV